MDIFGLITALQALESQSLATRRSLRLGFPQAGVDETSVAIASNSILFRFVGGRNDGSLDRQRLHRFAALLDEPSALEKRFEV